MEWLLKIIEGPMKGAEIALVEGLRVRVGSGEDCDIVLADAALPAEAFALDVKSDAVSFIRGEDVKTLVPFEVFDVGTSAFAIGPAEGVWEPLKKVSDAALNDAAKGEATSKSLQGDSIDAAETREATVDAASSPRPNKDDHSTSDATGPSRPQDASAPLRLQDASASSRLRHRILLAGCCALVVLLIVLAAAWYFWPTIAETCPQTETARVTCVGWFRSACGARAQQPPAPSAPAPTLADLARQYNLVLTNHPQSSLHCPLSSIRYPSSSIHYPLLRGNFARRTERMAVRALALAADPTVKLELTDDESLAAAAAELLFVVTENDMTVTSATNGVVTLAGFAPSAASLERTIRALNDDVPGLRNVLTAAVRIGGLPPPKPSEPKQVFADAPQTTPVASTTGEVASRRVKKNPALRIFPIAGILTTPYKTVVLENGMRVTEGGAINNVLVERIEPDRIVFRSGATTFEWKP